MLNIELLYDPAISLPNIPQRIENRYSNNTYIQMFIAALFTVAKRWNQVKKSVNRQMDKETGIERNKVLIKHGLTLKTLH